MSSAERQFIEMDWQIRLKLFIDRESGLLIRQRLLLLSTLQCSGDQIEEAFVGALCALSRFASVWKHRLLNTCSRKRLQISYLLMAFTSEEHSCGDRQHSVHYIRLAGAEVEEGVVITDTLYSNHFLF